MNDSKTSAENLKEIVHAVRRIVDEAERMRGAYFFTPPANAYGRRKDEQEHSHAKVQWKEGGHAYTAEYCVSCSCRNVYARGTYTRDGKETTITAIRNSLKRMESASR